MNKRKKTKKNVVRTIPEVGITIPIGISNKEAIGRINGSGAIIRFYEP